MTDEGVGVPAALTYTSTEDALMGVYFGSIRPLCAYTVVVTPRASEQVVIYRMVLSAVI